MERPTAEEVCRTLAIMSMFADEDDQTMTLIYKMTYARDGGGNCPEAWIKQFRMLQEYLENKNKAPGDPTKTPEGLSPRG